MSFFVGFFDMIREFYFNFYVGFGIDFGFDFFKFFVGFKECFWCIKVKVGCGCFINKFFKKV